MTDVEIIRMARASGINFEPATKDDDGIDTWHGDQYLPNGAVQKLIAIAQEAEREALYKICEKQMELQYKTGGSDDAMNQCLRMMDAIRARK